MPPRSGKISLHRRRQPLLRPIVGAEAATADAPLPLVKGILEGATMLTVTFGQKSRPDADINGHADHNSKPVPAKSIAAIEAALPQALSAATKSFHATLNGELAKKSLADFRLVPPIQVLRESIRRGAPGTSGLAAWRGVRVRLWMDGRSPRAISTDRTIAMAITSDPILLWVACRPHTEPFRTAP